MGEPDDPLMTVSEVAELFRVDPKTVARWRKHGRMQSVRTPGGHHRFRKSEVDRVLKGVTRGQDTYDDRTYGV